ncbi:MAG TPA: GAF domain-containing protein [Trebonia sp.]|nr:GAF domain-containing protein [Trebonia sp.]
MSPTNSTASPAPEADLTQRRLLQSVVEIAKGMYGAAAVSVFLVDPATGELVFEAVAGEGEGMLPGTRFPSGTGIAGWVAMSGQPLIADDLASTPLFAQDAAESTGYVPRSIMAAPVIVDGDCIGVLEVLDRDTIQRGDLVDMDSVGMLATEVASVLQLLLRVRWSERENQAAPQSPGLEALRRVAQRLPGAPQSVQATVVKLLTMADELLEGGGTAAA